MAWRTPVSRWLEKGRAMMRQILIGLLILLAAGCTTIPNLIHTVEPDSSQQFFLEEWLEVLRTHICDGVVDYPAIHRQGHLASYLVLLDRMDSNQLSRGHRLAFLINVYNPFAVKGILAHDSPEILFGRYRYFIAKEYQVGGRTVNPYNLEREILIAQFHAPRMQFEFVCVSASCPKLQSWADEGQDLDQ